MFLQRLSILYNFIYDIKDMFYTLSTKDV